MKIREILIGLAQAMGISITRLEKDRVVVGFHKSSVAGVCSKCKKGFDITLWPNKEVAEKLTPKDGYMQVMAVIGDGPGKPTETRIAMNTGGTVMECENCGACVVICFEIEAVEIPREFAVSRGLITQPEKPKGAPMTGAGGLFGAYTMKKR